MKEVSLAGGVEWRFVAPAAEKSRNVNMTNNKVVVRVEYEDGTILETSIDESGSPSMHVNKDCVIDEAKHEIRIAAKN